MIQKGKITVLNLVTNDEVDQKEEYNSDYELLFDPEINVYRYLFSEVDINGTSENNDENVLTRDYIGDF